MPTQVHNRPTDTIPRVITEKHYDHDPSSTNKNIQHKEALRLALGSILTPKRPYTPSSRSGTASPAFPFPQQTPSPPHHSSDVQPRPQDPHLLYPRHSHPHQSHQHTPSRLGHVDDHHQSHTPGESNTPASLSPPGISRATSELPSPIRETAPPFPNDSTSPVNDGNHRGGPVIEHLGPVPPHPQHPRPQLHPLPPHNVQNQNHPMSSSTLPQSTTTPDSGSGPAGNGTPGMGPGTGGTGTPKAKFFETLQSKSAWEALIHGSFS